MAPPTLLMFFLVEQCRPVRKPDKIVIHNHLFIAKALQCHQTWNKAVVSLSPFVSYVVKDNWKTYGQIMVHKKSNRRGLRIEKKWCNLVKSLNWLEPTQLTLGFDYSKHTSSRHNKLHLQNILFTEFQLKNKNCQYDVSLLDIQKLKLNL